MLAMSRDKMAIEYRWSEGRPDRPPALAADLVVRKVEVIVTAGASALATAAKNATSTIPIVFVTGADPVAAGLITSLSRPGGNLTGATFQSNELMPKRVELLSDLVPQARLVALLVNPNAPESSNEAFIRDTREAARAKGMELDVLKAGTESEIDAAFTTLVQLKLDALLVTPDGFFPTRAGQIAALASRYAVPAVYSVREYPDAGGLISYGSTLPGTAYQAGIYVGKILKGAKPADLPVQQPTLFELVVNLKTAKELGLTVPPAILARADEVIE
jgi:putative tryptophan/tyrosine transport system substrate-binding protein